MRNLLGLFLIFSLCNAMDSDIDIREYTPADYSVVMRMMHRSRMPGVHDDCLPSILKSVGGPALKMLCARVQEKIVGFIVFSKSSDWRTTGINFVLVDELHRRKGIGTRLIGEVRDISVENVVMVAKKENEAIRRICKNLEFSVDMNDAYTAMEKYRYNVWLLMQQVGLIERGNSGRSWVPRTD